jgi:hypothetical protein
LPLLERKKTLIEAHTGVLRGEGGLYDLWKIQAACIKRILSSQLKDRRIL